MAQKKGDGRSVPAGSESPRPGWLRRLIPQRSITLAILAWLLVNAVVLLFGGGGLPFDRPLLENAGPVDQLAIANAALIEVFLLMGIVWALTRHRAIPDIAARAPARAAAMRETVGLLGYGVLGLLGGFALGRALGGQAFGFHVAGTIFGTHQIVTPVEVVGWAAYNVVVYAVVPYLFFRRRYSNVALNLNSSDRGNDVLVIIVVLTIETAFQLTFLSPAILSLTPQQLAVGIPLTFVLYLLGTGLPAMVFIYCILVPRFLALTGSAATTVILGGLTYTAMHVWDAWTAFTSPTNALLSCGALVMLYFGPGMFKTFLTIRTGNAWVHLWAYHAIAPHTLVDTPHMVEAFHIK